ncbi:N-acetyltransferase [Sporosarcina sp. NCCP-2716]|uniref:GNAT family N-acetyltransferase n=1 Tax=Sporosarcina sp. NCCP-2716 TaxID=2943679 RepID=UPI00203DA042|nr:GNAT family N-acetyltransferase [Sporosarcina sp. NCCP-2716]GKV68661.1 N-acetyltransferase [Sporosarcina sp. NCCP-2716]
MKIRQLELEDAEAYLALRLEALQNDPDSFAASFEEEKDQTAEKYRNRFAAPDHTVTYGAFDDDSHQLIGVVTLFREQRLKLRHRANVTAMYTKPDNRGCGIGKALLTQIIETARGLEDIEQVYLAVVSQNGPAKKLYASLGFETFGIEKNALKINDMYFDEELMVLFLYSDL